MFAANMTASLCWSYVIDWLKNRWKSFLVAVLFNGVYPNSIQRKNLVGFGVERKGVST